MQWIPATISDLIYASLEDDLSAEKAAVLEAWLQESPANRSFLEALQQESGLRKGISQQFLRNDDQAKLWQRIADGLPDQRTKPGKVHRIHFLGRAWLRYVAALLLIAGTVTFLYTAYPPHKEIVSNQPTTSIPDIQPGGNKAILTLSDGRRVVLDSAAIGSLAKQGGTEIRKVDAGALAYYEASSSEQLLYNTISTPNGGQYRVTLPDGTSVWLNAASSVTFSTAFTKERAVTVTGEVYFDISPDKVKPFIVSTHDIKIKVLGTSFNINAYENEQSVKTTLVNGSVQVLAAENTSLQQQVLLQPGQQARWAAGASNQPDRKVLSIVPSVELDKVIAWKQGLFDFNGVDLQEQMRQIERWYDIEIVYENGIPDERFVGKIYRSSSLPTLLKAFESANIRFRAAGRKIIVLNDVK